MPSCRRCDSRRCASTDLCPESNPHPAPAVRTHPPSPTRTPRWLHRLHTLSPASLQLPLHSYS
eukprot:4210141-Prymnesium_polylepis.2